MSDDKHVHIYVNGLSYTALYYFHFSIYYPLFSLYVIFNTLISRQHFSQSQENGVLTAYER